MKKIFGIALLFIMISMMAVGCSADGNTGSPLDPEKPITVTVWHYYNGNIKDKFDALVSEFNETKGIDLGIVVDAQSQGDVGQLATAVYESASKSIGAQPMPDIFAAYPDNAFRVHEITELVNLETYFTSSELEEYRAEFLEEGRFLTDKKLYILPIAKSSENLYVNGTLWKEFAEANGFTQDTLRTWEGLTEVAEIYYENTGKGFFGIDANANYMLQAGMQLGQELFEYDAEGNAEFFMDEKTGRKIWENYYIPYIKGYFVKTGRFSSDDAKTGTVLAYTGSTAGASYFPTEVTFSENDIIEIEPLILPYPYFEEGTQYAMQQGAGMCISRSDYIHEYASAEFLKWFTQVEQNTEFAVSTGYFPVKNEALSKTALLGAAENAEFTNPAILASIESTITMFETYKFYNNPPFIGSFEIRELLESHLYNKITSNLELLESAGENRDIMIEEMISEASFMEWFNALKMDADQILNP